MGTLFEVGAELEALSALLEEVGGDISDPTVESAINTWFAEIMSNEGAKLEQYARLIRRWESEAEIARAEAKAYAARASSREKSVDRLKDRMMQYLLGTKRTSVKTETGRTISIRQNGGKMPIVYMNGATPDTVPSKYTRRDFDPEQIRAALLAGEHLGFARLADRGIHIRITT